MVHASVVCLACVSAFVPVAARTSVRGQVAQDKHPPRFSKLVYSAPRVIDSHAKRHVFVFGKRSARSDLSNDTLFGTDALFDVKESSFENRSRGCVILRHLRQVQPRSFPTRPRRFAVCWHSGARHSPVQELRLLRFERILVPLLLADHDHAPPLAALTTHPSRARSPPLPTLLFRASCSVPLPSCDFSVNFLGTLNGNNHKQTFRPRRRAGTTR